MFCKLFLQKKINQKIAYRSSNVSLYIKREDLLHPFVSGNKYRKLKYNIAQAKAENQQLLVTFGGAFSNHIAAVAYACQEAGIKSIGMIRGEELASSIAENATLTFAQNCGMQFEFVSREVYKSKTDFSYLENLTGKFGKHYLLPEGGTNALAIKGCEEILEDSDADFDFICTCVGTGGTVAGIINSAKPHQKVLGFSALKGNFLEEEIAKFVQNKNWALQTDYHFGGYAKVTPELIEFMNEFYLETNIPLDPVYTGKMMFGVIDLIEKKYFPDGSKILVIHTGGLQGIAGMNAFLAKKNEPQIVY